MTNREIMRSSLKQHTFPFLNEKGFTGKYPLFKRVCEDRVELIYFQTNKWGGSFTVEVSAVFPNSDDTNYSLTQDLQPDSLRMDCTNRRYRLPGMFDGWFHYWDVYKKYTLFFGNTYHGISEKEALTFVPTKGYRLVQRFDENTAVAICQEVNRQLDGGFRWLETMQSKQIGRNTK